MNSKSKRSLLGKGSGKASRIVLKTVVHTAIWLPLCWLFWTISQGQAGGEPVERLIHFTGMSAMNLLLITLVVSPLAKYTRQPILMSLRRLLGLSCFAYACLHLLSYVWLDLGFDGQLFIEEILNRAYLWLGMGALVLLLALAVTSANVLRRKMKQHWQQLHNSIYGIVILVWFHYQWSQKSGWVEPSIYAVLAIVLLMLRYSKFKRILPLKLLFERFK